MSERAWARSEKRAGAVASASGCGAERPALCVSGSC